MAEVKVNFVHPIDGGFRPATVDDTMKVKELISLLVSENFVPGPEEDIELVLKNKNNDLLLGDKTLQESGVTENSTLRVVMATNAGIK